MRRIFIQFLTMMTVSGFSAQAYSSCSAQVERTWNGVTLQALSQGDACSNSVVTLVVRDKAGKPIWVRAYIASQLMSFASAPIENSKAKAKAAQLSDWISGKGFMQSVEKLDTKSEFPFTVSDQIDAKTFALYRKQKLPVFCYVQGMESGNCLLLDRNGEVVEIGVQRFPG